MLRDESGLLLIQDMTDEKLEAITAPKTVGAAAFAAAHLPLLSQTIFSSTAAVCLSYPLLVFQCFPS